MISLKRNRSGLLATDEVNRAARLYVQANDNRGLRLYRQIKRGVIASNVARLWAAINWHYRPEICADIGANYGEVSLTTRYEVGQAVYLFEANPYVLMALQQSIKSHGNSDQIFLRPYFVSDGDGEVEFNIDLKWSGTSSAFFRRLDDRYKGEGRQEFETTFVSKKKLSTLIPERDNSRFLLKIDVEGAELEVLRGAKELLESVNSYFIIMEFNRAVIRLKGDDATTWLKAARALGNIYVIRKEKVVPLREGVMPSAGKADLLIVSVGEDEQARRALRVARSGPL